MQKVRFIYNPKSGETVISEWLDHIIEIYQGHGYTVVPYRLCFGDTEETDMFDGVDQSYHHALIAGGDGTVNYVVNVMKRRGLDVPVAVHTINARTGEPVISNLLSVTVVGPTATLADAYGTVCMILGLEKSKEFLAGHPELHAYLIYSDDRGNYQTYLTPGMEAMIARQASTRQ